MNTRIGLIAALLLVLTTIPGVTRSRLAATPQTPSTSASQQSQSNMQDMMKTHEQMMAAMKAGDAKLDALVKEMNASTGESKLNAVASVVNELVRQHKSMHARMGQMHEQMMGGRGMMMKR